MKNNKGQALVEFIIVLPILLLCSSIAIFKFLFFLLAEIAQVSPEAPPPIIKTS